jgi:acid-sensing ion channel 2
MNAIQLHFSKKIRKETGEMFQVNLPNPTQVSPNTPDKKESINGKLKDYILDWCSYCTAHGISNISRVKSKLVLSMWICLYLASIAYCFFCIINILIVFFQYHVLINMEFENDPPIDFPAVTVCNLNPFDKRYAEDYIKTVLSANNKSYVYNLSLIDIEPAQVYKLIKSAVISDSTLNDSARSQLGFSLDYMQLRCQFNGIQCNRSEITRTYNFDYGNCYTFNSGYDSNGNKIPIKQISQAGSDKSFQLELFLGDESVQSDFLLNSGARVIVHNQSITPIYQSEGRDVASGYLTNIGVTRSFFSKLSKPYSDCVKETSSPEGYESEYYKAIFNVLKMKLYRQKNCLPLCLQDYIKETCGCLDGSLPNISNRYKYCNNLKELECIGEKNIEYFQNQGEMKKCHKYCPLECDSSIYLLTYIYIQVTSNIKSYHFSLFFTRTTTFKIKLI